MQVLTEVSAVFSVLPGHIKCYQRKTGMRMQSCAPSRFSKVTCPLLLEAVVFLALGRCSY